MSFSITQPTLNLALRHGMDHLADFIRSLPQVGDDQVKLTHRFTPGMYFREINLPKGSLNISKIHKTRHPFVISKGHVEVYNRLTKKVEHHFAPHTGITEPGTQRAVFAHEDSVWTTFHPTDLTDLDEVEEYLIAKPDEGSITLSDEGIQKLNRGRLT